MEIKAPGKATPKRREMTGGKTAISIALAPVTPALAWRDTSVANLFTERGNTPAFRDFGSALTQTRKLPQWSAWCKLQGSTSI